MEGLFNSFRTAILCLLWLLPFTICSVAAQTTVFVTSQHSSSTIQLAYSQPVRLAQIYSDVKNQQSAPRTPVFWAGAALFDLSQDNEYEVKKQLVVKQLNQLALQNIQSEPSILALKKYISSLRVAKRIFQPLDPDLIRIKPSLNPLLQGHYLLTLPSRPDSVLTIGAVGQPVNIPWQERADANYYLTQAKIMKGAAKDHAWIIQPDGQVQQHPIAYWNYQYNDIAPGAIAYLPFDSLSSELNNLNQNIIQLLRNRVSE